MKRNLHHLWITAVILLTASYADAQHRYVDEVFTDVLKTSNIEYDSNRSVNILYGSVPGQLPIITVSLTCDIYEPTGDTEMKRPLVILASTGSFLPPIINRQPTGSKDDSSIVEVANKFAKRGYVVIAMNYRQGWNPQTTSDEDAKEQLLKATFRGIQDVKNCIRFARENATTYKLDTSRIIVGGQGTGGYIAYAVGTIDKRAEIESNLKFLRSDATPMVNMDTLGDWNGLGGIMLPGYPFYMNYSGDPNVSANAHMVFNYGGAMGDTAWLETNSLPVVSMNCVMDPFAPYATGNVVVPGTSRIVIPNASGGGDVIPRANALDINATMSAAAYADPISPIALQLAGGVKNLYPFYTATPESAPWEWWDRTIVQNINFPTPGAGHFADSVSMITNPTMSATKGKAYCDTVVRFIAPRIAVQLGLATFSGLHKLALNNVLELYPNPAQSVLTVKLPSVIREVRILDIMGKEIMNTGADSREVTMALGNVKPGMYFVNVKAIDGRSAVKRIVVE